MTDGDPADSPDEQSPSAHNATAAGGFADRQPLRLGGVPETLLWNLYQRAHEARHPRTVLPDPKAVELVDRLDYPFEATFGPPNPVLAQGHALRVRTFDSAVRAFLDRHPDGTVVALAEGLETQYWRIDNGRAHWLCVELPETARVRRSLLPDGGRRRILARSALDPSWRAEVNTSRPVLVTAQGLLMYLQPQEVHDLIASCAEAFGGGALVFDAVPRWFSTRTVEGRMRTPQGYVTPPMPWGLDAGELRTVRAAHPGITGVRELPLPRGRGAYYGSVAPFLHRLPGVRNIRPTMTAIARFA